METVDVTYHGPSGSFALGDTELIQGQRTTVTRDFVERLQGLRLNTEHRLTVHPQDAPPASAAVDDDEAPAE